MSDRLRVRNTHDRWTFARPAQLIGVFLHAVWTVESYIHLCIAGCHARDTLGTYLPYVPYVPRFCAYQVWHVCTENAV